MKDVMQTEQPQGWERKPEESKDESIPRNEGVENIAETEDLPGRESNVSEEQLPGKEKERKSA